MKRLERGGLAAPAAAEAVKTPVIISNKIGRGITPDEAERAKAETVQKLMRWKVRDYAGLRAALLLTVLCDSMIRQSRHRNRTDMASV